LAQGLAYKVSVYFCCEKIDSEDSYHDTIFIYGNSFKQEVTLKAFSPRGQLIFPVTYNFGRLLVGNENFRSIPLKNNGKAASLIKPECSSASTVAIMNE